MILEQAHLYEALLRWNYFPNQKKGLSELPPILQTRQFTPDIAEIITKERHRHNGYGIAEYKSTRFNNIPRTLGLVHPYAHAKLSKLLIDHWDEYYNIYLNYNSAVRPEMHADGRAFIMNYEDYEKKVSKSLENSFGKNFRAHTDISNCFNSIYTHSVEWALRGFEETKLNRNKGKKEQVRHWAQDLDNLLSQSKRKETHGIPIGPGTSSIVVEIILSKVDKKLSEKGYEFIRYIDDYTCLCETHSKAQEFIRDLGSELSTYKLSLNLAKTAIVEQPEPLQPAWVTELISSKPSIFIDNQFNTRKISLSEAIHYLDHAIRINKNTPDGSVIKFAISSVINHIDEDDKLTFANYVTNLSWHYPILLPFLNEMGIGELHFKISQIPEKLIKIASNSAHHKRSDGMAWPIYYLIKYNLPIPLDIAGEIIKSNDCVSICLLLKDPDTLHLAIDYANTLIDYPDYYKDEYWILLYQLYFANKIENPYINDETFKILKDHNVNFMPDENTKSSAEDYTEMKNMGFIENPSYEDYLLNGARIQ